MWRSCWSYKLFVYWNIYIGFHVSIEWFWYSHIIFQLGTLSVMLIRNFTSSTRPMSFLSFANECCSDTIDLSIHQVCGISSQSLDGISLYRSSDKTAALLQDIQRASFLIA